MARGVPGLIGSVKEETGYGQLTSSLFLLFRDLPAIEEPMFWSGSMMCMLKYWGENIRWIHG